MSSEQYKEMVIIQKTYDMIEYAYVCMRQFPKSEKFTLAAEIKTSMYTLLKLLIAASKKYYKKTTLQEIDIELQFLKTANYSQIFILITWTTMPKKYCG